MKKQIEVVAGIIKKDHLVFCCKRPNKGECALKWEFPGGKIEKGETHQQALIREIKEELACNIEIDEFIMTIDYEYTTFYLRLHVYLCHLTENEPILLEHIAACWQNINALDELDFASADKKIINELKKRYQND